MTNDSRWYGRSYPLDPQALQLRLHVELPRARRAAAARLFQVPSAQYRHDSPLWQHVEGWAFDPESVGPLLTLDDAAERLIAPLVQMRIPGIG